jgi:dGTPase
MSEVPSAPVGHRPPVGGRNGEISSRYDRRVNGAAEEAIRSETERDRDRVLYASAFRRLAGVTQVAAATETVLLHNRLTHSLKVGQVGRKIANELNELSKEPGPVRSACFRYGGANTRDYDRPDPVDPWVLECAGMIHDLGHPPFGHIAETELNFLLSPEANSLYPDMPSGRDLPDGFEGNAQTFRIVTRLSVGKQESDLPAGAVPGLNLTRATLSGISKYPWLRQHRPQGVDADKEKWGAYNTENDLLLWCMQGINGEHNLTGRPRPDGELEYRSVEAQAMDWADDITYAVHDLEDFSRAGLIPLAELGTFPHMNAPLVAAFWNYCQPRLRENRLLMQLFADKGLDPDGDLEREFLDVIGSLPRSASGRRVDRELFRTWAAKAIDSLTGPETLAVDPETGFLHIARDALLQVEILKKMTWFFVIDRPSLRTAQHGQRRMIRELFVWLLEWVDGAYDGPETESSSESRLFYTKGGLPPRLVDFLDIAHWQPTNAGGYRTPERRNARAVADFLSSLTEIQAMQMHGRLSGTNVAATLDDWFSA